MVTIVVNSGVPIWKELVDPPIRSAPGGAFSLDLFANCVSDCCLYESFQVLVILFN